MATHGMKRKERQAFEKRWRKEKSRGLPSNAAIHRYLPQFHSAEEEVKRVEGTAFIPESNANLLALRGLNQPLIACIQQQSPSMVATLDQDATLTNTHKRNALYCYKGFKAYQPFNTFWAEHGMLLHSAFRDGNVNAGFGQYCAEGSDPRFGVIPFAIAARVTAGIKKEAQSLDEKLWHPIYQEAADGTKIKTHQEWADICFVPEWAVQSKASYRYLAIREAMKPVKTKSDEEPDLPFQTMKSDKVRYKLFAVVTNRNIDGSDLIQWHRKRCGKSEHVHSTQKEGLAGGQLPSNLFGANAAWWAIMVLSFNLNRLMQIAALPKELKESKIKALRFHIIQQPGRVIHHARYLYVRVEGHCYELLQLIRTKITKVCSGMRIHAPNTS